VANEYLENVQGLRPLDSVAFDPNLDSAIDHFMVVSRLVLADIEEGNVEAAVQHSHQGLEGSYQQLEQLLSDEQTRILGVIDETESAIGRVSTIANIIVTLLIPGCAIAIYFFFARRQMRERKLAMEYQVEAAHELARSKDEFIAGVSHELRTPLTAIYGFSDVLLSNGVLEAHQAKDLVSIINSESGELMRMVDDILTGARLDAGALSLDPAPVEIRPELESVLLPFQRAGIDINLCCGDATVVADRLRLRQVLRNLVSNAHKHGGPEIAVSTKVRGTDLVIAVVDNGPGVPESIEGNLFRRFIHDGRRAVLTGSVGLGLAIARNLTEAMDGSLRYDRIENHTVFSLTLPLAATPIIQHDLEWYSFAEPAAPELNGSFAAVSNS
jgi:signal transduction histidine kinase